MPQLSGTRQAHAAFNFKRVYTDIYAALKNRAFFALFWGTLVFAVFMGVHGALSMHTKTFFWELDTKGIQLVQYAGVGGGLLGLALIGCRTSCTLISWRRRCPLRRPTHTASSKSKG